MLWNAETEVQFEFPTSLQSRMKMLWVHLDCNSWSRIPCSKEILIVSGYWIGNYSTLALAYSIPWSTPLEIQSLQLIPSLDNEFST